jgi:2-polyprenyl-6-methoxyphenol hydroxylase-like FAD-dependent oxidoreductase
VLSGRNGEESALQNPVLIVGAGPTGLVLALWLRKQGVDVRIIDTSTGPGLTSRALAVQARTLELYRQLDLAEAVLARGHKVPSVNLWVRGRPTAHLEFDHIGRGLTPYDFLEIFPQDEHDRLLIDRARAFGVSVERDTELIAVSEREDGVIARLRAPDGTEHDFAAAYLAGCDGAHSTVRHALGIGFPGGDYRQLFYVADVEASGPTMDGALHIDLDEADFLAVFPLSGQGRARLIGTVRDDRVERAASLSFADVSRRAIENLQLQVSRVNWFSTYHVHHRVAERFRKGRCFLLGDAAHIHSPAGGQGMNTGIGDAINLAWKIAAVTLERAKPAILDTYETERIAFARRLVATTDRVFTLATADGAVADFIRTRLVPILAPAAFRVPVLRRFLFRTVSQIGVNYRGSALSRGSAGRLRGGDRMPYGPDLSGDGGGGEGVRWRLHVFGTASSELKVFCDDHGIALSVCAWSPRFDALGLVRDAVYLTRPDTYLAFAAIGQEVSSLSAYMAQFYPHGA